MQEYILFTEEKSDSPFELGRISYADWVTPKAVVLGVNPRGLNIILSIILKYPRLYIWIQKCGQRVDHVTCAKSAKDFIKYCQTIALRMSRDILAGLPGCIL